MLGLGRRPIRIKIVRLYIATARLCPATVFGDCHCLNDRAAKNNAAVGAAIGRPSADRREKTTNSIITSRAPARQIF